MRFASKCMAILVEELRVDEWGAVSAAAIGCEKLDY
jgi:hypothetical protein